jgi:Domain of unknown function (DUF1992).
MSSSTNNESPLEWTAIVAERKIADAIAAGEFDDLPGKGQPLDLESDPFTPVELRVANRLLKNARALPPWLQLEKDMERMRAEMEPRRERGLRAVRFARNAAARQRAIERLRADHRERMDLINTLLLKYNETAPRGCQRILKPYNLKNEMALLEDSIRAAIAAAERGTM